MDKKSAIVQMYYGLRGQADHLEMNEEERKILTELIEKEDVFVKTLTPEQVKMYEDTKWKMEEMSAEECDQYYVEGFRFGVLMGMDILKE